MGQLKAFMNLQRSADSAAHPTGLQWSIFSQCCLRFMKRNSARGVGSVIPRLVSHDGRLQYHFKTQYEKSNKQQYKNYLANVKAKLATPISAVPETKRNASTEDPLSRSKVAILLLEMGEGSSTISVFELSRILQA